MYGSMNTVPSPNAEVASREAASIASGQVGLAAHDAHAPPAAAGGGLHQRRHGEHRRAPAQVDASMMDVVGTPASIAGPLGGHLVAQQSDLFGRGAHPGQPGGLDRRAKSAFSARNP
jgi:hypothetical protein